jgi:hypothetical protein
MAWLRAFFDQVTAAGGGQIHTPIEVEAARSRDLEATARELDRIKIGIRGTRS